MFLFLYKETYEFLALETLDKLKELNDFLSLKYDAFFMHYLSDKGFSGYRCELSMLLFKWRVTWIYNDSPFKETLNNKDCFYLDP